MAKEANPSQPAEPGPTTTSPPVVWPAVRQPPAKTLPPGLRTIDELWIKVLEAVKTRRRYGWFLLKEKARISRFDGKVIRLEFVDCHSMDSYLSTGVDSILEGLIRELFDHSWRVEAAIQEVDNVSAVNSQGKRKESQSGGFSRGVTESAGHVGKVARRPGEWPIALNPELNDDRADGIAAIMEVWPRILEVVKSRRRFAWILLVQNAKVASFDGETLRIEFVNDVAKKNYLSAGVGEVLEKVILEEFHLAWRIDVGTML
ncbi:hypothetical protein [Streptomyces prasinus]|uniref:hypothetical protein n=1 Tax=Streptomyces prasinus TaxID=67345 RepID=UPI003698AC02